MNNLEKNYKNRGKLSLDKLYELQLKLTAEASGSMNDNNNTTNIIPYHINNGY